MLGKRTEQKSPPEDVVQSCIMVSTYIDIKDSMQLQYEVGQDKSIKVIIDNPIPGRPNVVYTRRNWMQSIIHCQKIDNGKYGDRFPDIPEFYSKITDTRILWFLSDMMVCVKTFWLNTDKCEIKVSNWHGWLLTYLTKACFPGVRLKDESNNPFKHKFITTFIDYGR